MRTQLGTEVKRARTARGLSLEAAGAAAGISQGYLHKLEAGGVESPSPRVLQRLAEVLGMPYARLMALCDYLLPEPGAPAAPPPTSAAPTNAELLRALEAVRDELAELRRDVAALRPT